MKGIAFIYDKLFRRGRALLGALVMFLPAAFACSITPFPDFTAFDTVFGDKLNHCGFSDPDYCIFVTAATHGGYFDNDAALEGNNDTNGTPEADKFCMKDSNYPGYGVYKALLGDNTYRNYTLPDTWVLKPNTLYKRTDGKEVMITDANGIFVFGTLTNAIGDSGKWWTGLDANWSPAAFDHCSFYNSAGAPSSGEFGIGGMTNQTSINNAGGEPCNTDNDPTTNLNAKSIICVEQ